MLKVTRALVRNRTPTLYRLPLYIPAEIQIVFVYTGRIGLRRLVLVVLALGGLGELGEGHRSVSRAG